MKDSTRNVVPPFSPTKFLTARTASSSDDFQLPFGPQQQLFPLGLYSKFTKQRNCRCKCLRMGRNLYVDCLIPSVQVDFGLQFASDNFQHPATQEKSRNAQMKVLILVGRP